MRTKRNVLAMVSLICSLVAWISAAGKLDGYARSANGVYHGRYTRDISEAELLIPRRVHEDGAFHTYELPNFYDLGKIDAIRQKRSADARLFRESEKIQALLEKVHLIVGIAGLEHQVELEPYREFISPDMVIERRSIGVGGDEFSDGLSFRAPSDQQCHYRGAIRGYPDSRAVLSLCDGLVGYVQTKDGRYFIEPLHEDVPDADGQHVHVAYKKEVPNKHAHDENGFCGTKDDWESAWSKRLEQQQQRQLAIDVALSAATSNSGSASHNLHRYIEVAVVADRRFLDFHNNTNYEQYLLTVMNMVSDFYHDASVGNQIDVVVVRMIFLERENEEIDLHISTDGERTLNSFANWVEKLNPSDAEHPNHFDVGALVTRYDICAEGNNCNLLGLAFVAAACERKKAACINEDSGLLLGIVIAHEIGHTLGCAHDTEQISGCLSKDADDSYYVMSPIVFIYTIRWSECSRKFITNFLESGLGECLNNNPKNPSDKYKYPEMLPGAMYDAKFQCNLIYPGSTSCELEEEDCTDLWCSDGGKECKSKGGPPADGTKCAENKWCIHKKCVEMGARDDAVNGGWANWGKFAECSRTCGGGVRFAERECNNPAPKNAGRYCIGERKSFATCNTQPCDVSKPSFRSVQCVEEGKKMVLPGSPHKWTSYLREDLDACALYCVNQANTFIKMSPTVKDGTPCKAGTYDMCISGVCRKVGCDWVIDSDAVKDVCGTCKGGGTECSKIEGDYTETSKTGYRKIVIIPKGSRNIRVYEKSEHKNTLAVKLSKTNKYCLNGNYREQLSGEYSCAGAFIIYKHIKTEQEEIEVKEPISEDIEIQYVLYDSSNPGVHYEYYIGTPDKSYTPKYSWEFIEWSECDAKCGGGTKISETTCVEERAGKVGPEFCKGIKRPSPKSQICNEMPCPAKWRVSQWSQCSGCGGQSGEQRRKIQCLRPGPHVADDYVLANFDACEGKPPIQTRHCTSTRPCLKPCPSKRETALVKQSVSTKDRRRMVDELVDFGLARYLEKTRNEQAAQKLLTTERQSEHEIVDFTKLLRDWLGENVDRLDDLGEYGIDAAMTNLTTPVPGSIVIDSVPASDIAVYKAPRLRGNLSNANFQRQEDVTPDDSLDTRNQKVYRAGDAVHKPQRANRNVLQVDNSCKTTRRRIHKKYLQDYEADF